MSDYMTAKQIQERIDGSPFIAFMQLEVVSADAETDTIVMKMPMRPEFERRPGTGQMHGGPIAAFIDTVGDWAIGMKLGGGVPTINFRVDYLRPAINTDLTGTAVIRRAGRSVAIVDIDVTNDEGRLLAVGRGTYSGQTG